MAVEFATSFLLLLLALHNSNNSLLSRFRNPNELIAPVDIMIPDELDHDTYEDLLQEVPELRGRMKWHSRDPLRMPYLKNNFEQSDEYDFMINGIEEENFTDTTMPSISERNEWNSTFNVSSVTLAGPSYNASNSSDARRWWEYLHYWKGPKVATCYACNLRYIREIPISPICHNAFESQDWRAKTMARYFRAHCYRNSYHWGVKIESKWVLKRHHQYDRGLIRGYYGGYHGGCFKRFLDVGEVYTTRGCRSWLPKVGGGYANHRFQKLELLLRGQKNVCVMSPHASLTPFSRAISLYVRYHVCVCETKYCNLAAPFTTFVILYLLSLLNIIL